MISDVLIPASEATGHITFYLGSRKERFIRSYAGEESVSVFYRKKGGGNRKLVKPSIDVRLSKNAEAYSAALAAAQERAMAWLSQNRAGVNGPSEFSVAALASTPPPASTVRLVEVIEARQHLCDYAEKEGQKYRTAAKYFRDFERIKGVQFTVEGFRSSHLESFILFLNERGAFRGGDLSVASIEVYSSCVRAAWTGAQAEKAYKTPHGRVWSQLSQNTGRALEGFAEKKIATLLHRPTLVKKKPLLPTRDDWALLFLAADVAKKSPHYNPETWESFKNHLLIALVFGMRRRHIALLPLSKAFQGGVRSMTMDQLQVNNQAWLRDNKSRCPFTLKIPQDLAERIDTMRRRAHSAGRDQIWTDLREVTANWRQQSFDKLFSNRVNLVRSIAGMDGFKMGQTRQHVATLLLEGGHAGPRAFLGHSSTTTGYARIREDAESDEVLGAEDLGKTWAYAKDVLRRYAAADANLIARLKKV